MELKVRMCSISIKSKDVLSHDEKSDASIPFSVLRLQRWFKRAVASWHNMVGVSRTRTRRASHWMRSIAGSVFWESLGMHLNARTLANKQARPLNTDRRLIWYPRSNSRDPHLLYNNVGVFGLSLIRRVVYSHDRGVENLWESPIKLQNCVVFMFPRKKNVVKTMIELRR